ncbi:molybdopterin-dependent oxidoreductase [Streptomyces sp. NPDC012794]|uniref:molybdopterin-dependent oxidoreductase n=1 Tax=Streptomyces sp. NPDC012794 TaxID=3364850 RepID=UPI0036C5DC79
MRPPQHGYPIRLVVPGWYGMAHVKWCRPAAERRKIDFRAERRSGKRSRAGGMALSAPAIRPREMRCRAASCVVSLERHRASFAWLWGGGGGGPCCYGVAGLSTG